MLTLLGQNVREQLTWKPRDVCTTVLLLSRRFYSSHRQPRGRYDEAIERLNSLQTPYSVIKAQRAAGIRNDRLAKDSMVRDLKTLGYSIDDLNKLNIIHVAGTKGKGSTCAYVDSILKEHRIAFGRPTMVGLFTSPHLIEVRERIKINSEPISYLEFGKYFFEVWDRLEAASTPEQPYPKPSYFRYLCLMSYHVFLSKRVNLSIYEVGVGGEYDATNIVEEPLVTGITSIGIDHTFQLGNTIPEIAWQKAGIMKKGCPNFYVKQTEEAMNVIEARSAEKGASVCKMIDVFPAIMKGQVEVRPDADFQRLNASLAIRLVATASRNFNNESLGVTPLTMDVIRKGIMNMTLRGRCEIEEDPENELVKWYLDGAHTKESIEVAVKWYAEAVAKHKNEPRILVFNQQGDRDAMVLLEALSSCAKSEEILFDRVYFCPSSQPSSGSSKNDSTNLMLDEKYVAEKALQKDFATRWEEMNPHNHGDTIIADGPMDVRQQVCSRQEHQHVLVVGSIHLVGKMISSIDDPLPDKSRSSTIRDSII